MPDIFGNPLPGEPGFVFGGNTPSTQLNVPNLGFGGINLGGNPTGGAPGLNFAGAPTAPTPPIPGVPNPTTTGVAAQSPGGGADFASFFTGTNNVNGTQTLSQPGAIAGATSTNLAAPGAIDQGFNLFGQEQNGAFVPGIAPQIANFGLGLAQTFLGFEQLGLAQDQFALQEEAFRDQQAISRQENERLQSARASAGGTN